MCPPSRGVRKPRRFAPIVVAVVPAKEHVANSQHVANRRHMRVQVSSRGARFVWICFTNCAIISDRIRKSEVDTASNQVIGETDEVPTNRTHGLFTVKGKK
ncbi:hypothetical protein HPP92_026972 [Vanilla planifolia]|uniref:Uncharacterized protein n=1 Tax=Vanilla planifolia TaxID=51239 RepID=A0A835U6C1_VANPL|nr:hypothetical protein HPP92_026972 [Vanilla planifolia]KAG0476589.1 hypothetical protein HPP92_013430 [Vanilla planifolia]